MTADNSQVISQSAWKFFSGTLLSRISGMLRDVTMAFCFGTSPPLAGFLLAYRFVYLIRRLFGEGLLHQGFIPHFETTRSKNSKDGALFFRDLFWSLVFFLGGLLILGEIALFFTKGETARLAMWMLPGIFFICLFGLSTGLLQSERSFFLPSVSPVIFNIVWIVGILSLKHLPVSQAVIGLSITLSVAFFAQWLMTVPKLWAFLKNHLSFNELFQGRIFSSELKKLATPIFLGMIGVASVQINSAVDGIFARYADLSGPAYLWYAIRLQQLPLALFGIALSSALLPSLSRAIESGNLAQYKSFLGFAKKRIFTFIFPCCMGIFVLGLSSVNLIFGHGDFSSHATYQTTLCLWCYGIGLLPAAFVQILAPAFYAKKDYHTPMMGFVLSSLVNIALNSLFVFYFNLGAASIALGTSASAILNALFLSYKLKEKTSTFRAMFQVGLCTFLAGSIAMLLGYFFLKDPTLVLLISPPLSFPREFSSQLFQFGTQAALYFSLLLAFCKIARVEEMKLFLKK